MAGMDSYRTDDEAVCTYTVAGYPTSLHTLAHTVDKPRLRETFWNDEVVWHSFLTVASWHSQVYWSWYLNCIKLPVSQLCNCSATICSIVREYNRCLLSLELAFLNGMSWLEQSSANTLMCVDMVVLLLVVVMILRVALSSRYTARKNGKFDGL